MQLPLLVDEPQGIATGRSDESPLLLRRSRLQFRNSVGAARIVHLDGPQGDLGIVYHIRIELLLGLPAGRRKDRRNQENREEELAAHDRSLSRIRDEVHENQRSYLR